MLEQPTVHHRLTLRLEREDAPVLPLLGPSRAVEELARHVAEIAADGRSTVLLLGESGTGKGRLAEHIHLSGPRSDAPFAEVNCATTPATALDAELFGEAGLLVAASGGTLLIDEVADVSPELQPKLLAALEANAVDPDSPRVRVIAASSKDLVVEVNEGRLREDLYYRLSATPLHLLPLRARSRDDLAKIIEGMFTILRGCVSHSPSELSAEVVDCLVSYPWPGNIRELRNSLERALIVARGQPTLLVSHIPAELQSPGPSGDVVHPPRTLVDVERAHIHRTLHAHQLNRTHAARELGISRATLIKKIKQYGLAFRSAESV